MLKKILIALGIILGLLLILAALAVYYFNVDEGDVLKFIKNNPEKSAIVFYRNDTLLAEQNPDKMMTLASTVKIVVAIEYAHQAASGKINADERVALADLEKFHVPRTDGGAHSAWLKSLDTMQRDDSASIRDIAKGMIQYSSNANTEWLAAKLGLDNINKRLDCLAVKQHTKFYYIVSALFVGKKAFPGVKGNSLEEKMKAMSLEDYMAHTDTIHELLITDTAYKKEVGDMGLDLQKIWSDNLPASTVREYTEIVRKINRRDYFDSITQSYLNEVMEQMMSSPGNREKFQHAGMKGGSTSFVLTKALYATDKQGNTTELAYFFNELNLLQTLRWQSALNKFEIKMLKDEDFRRQVSEKFK